MNEYQRRHIAAAFSHVDKRLAEIEAVLQAVGSQSPFSAYALDIEPMARHTVAGYLQRLREKMWMICRDLEISETGHRTGAAWTINCTLTGVMIDLVELQPQRVARYGTLEPEMAKKLAGICTDLQRLCGSAQDYLARGRGEDLTQRLTRLTAGPCDRDALLTLETVITRHGLIELRPMLESIVSRLETRDLEIAFFGRVSSGKSSLLNYLLGEEILPIGVLPVTAVLTRLCRAEVNELVVRSEISPPRHLPLSQIAEFVTEEGNPGNGKRITEVQVRMANPRLSEGVAFMDTPGVGSLATLGAAQTKAYLPRCDLGILLVDAGSTMNHEDIGLLRGFFDAAIPAMILISKADLLNATDRLRVIDYVSDQTRKELGSEIPVYPVSTRSLDAAMADQWFTQAIVPLTTRHQDLATQSIQRKTAHLAELAASYLQTLAGQAHPAAGPANGGPDVAQVDTILTEADDRIAGVASRLTRPIEAGLSGQMDSVVEEAAKETVASVRRGAGCSDALVRSLMNQMAQTAEETRRQLEELARSLEQTLKKVSQAYGSTVDLTLNETIAAFTPLPLADEKRLHELPPVSCSKLIAWQPRIAMWLVRRRMMRVSNIQIWSALSDHRAKVQAWLRDNLESVGNAYEAYVAMFRDQLRHVGDGRVGFETVEQVQTDLALLRKMVPSHAASTIAAGTEKSECEPS